MSLTLHQPAASFDQLDYARRILQSESSAIQLVSDRLGNSFLRAVELIRTCTGRVILTGTGKSADIAQKIAGTFNSTGTRCFTLDPTKAVHGDLGMIAPEDIALALSHSGESEEIIRLLPSLQNLCSHVIGLTSNAQGTLARRADVAIVLGPLDEVCPLGLAPSTSTTCMLAVGDALAFVLSELRHFQKEDFARFHPAGSLGRKLMKVEQVMRPRQELRTASAKSTVREVFSMPQGKGRRTGAVLLLDDQGCLTGLFTDSDLARLFADRRDTSLDKPIAEVMTKSPLTIRVSSRTQDAIDLIQSRKISELPVVDNEGKPLGIIDITDLIGLVPAEALEAVAA